jgi:transposase
LKEGFSMLEIAEEENKALVMDHHGLVAAVCKDLKIAQRIDDALHVNAQRIVSPGKAVVAMILNGLGFTNRRLYLTHQFFETKPVNILLDAPIKAEDITDYTLGHTLDEIFSYGSSKLFGEVAFATVLENNLLGANNHLDSTSMTVYGDYKAKKVETLEVKAKASSEEEEDLEPKVMEITWGHSKAHRPDLKQVVMSLVVNGPAGVPIFMEPLSGNSSDKTSFHETIKKVNAFKKQINLEKDFRWIADSALYAKDKLLQMNGLIWSTRVPETITEAKKLVEKPDSEVEWIQQDDSYKTASFKSNYGNVEQRWIMVYSEQAYQREKKTLERNLIKKDKEVKKALWHLENIVFESKKEAIKAITKLIKSNKLHTITHQIVPALKYAKSGRPKEGDQQILTGYKVETNFVRNDEAIKKKLNKKGRFILATNDLDEKNYTDLKILNEYKGQQKVEGGFRFLKDPWFMVDSIFLKSTERIEALMMVMTLCLMVYNIAQYKLRQTLQVENKTLPNQLNQPVKNPTLRWLFQIMEGVSITRIFTKTNELAKEIIFNLNGLRKKIIELFGETARQMYGLTQKLAMAN